LEADLSRLTKKEDTAAKRREDVRDYWRRHHSNHLLIMTIAYMYYLYICIYICMYFSLYKLQVMNFIASSYYLLQAKRQRKAKREANSQNNLTSSNSISADDVKMDGSQSVTSLHSTAGTTADEDGKSVMRIGHRTIGDAREHEQMLIKVVQGQSVIHPSIH